LSVPSRKELLDDQLIVKLFGDMLTKYNISKDDIDQLLQRAKELWPRHHREVVLDEAVRRAIAMALTAVGVAFDDFSSTLKAALAQSLGLSRDDQRRERLGEVVDRRLSVLSTELRQTVHTTFRGLQDGVSGIMEAALREQESSLRTEISAILSGVFNVQNRCPENDGSVQKDDGQHP